MPSKKLGRADIIRWYSPKKYEEFRNLSLSEFVLQVIVRANYLAWLRSPEKPFGHLVKDFYQPFSKQARKAPVVDLDRFKVGSLYCCIRMKGQLSPKVGVAEMTIGQVRTAYNTFPQDVKEKIKHYSTSGYLFSLGSLEKMAAESKKIDLFYNKPINELNYLENDYLSVDLRATKDDLKRQFNNYLTRRHKTPKSNFKKFTKTDRVKWQKYPLLEYMDLEIYAEEQGKSITAATYGNLLFPDKASREDIARKALERIVKGLISRVGRDPLTQIHASRLEPIPAKKIIRQKCQILTSVLK